MSNVSKNYILDQARVSADSLADELHVSAMRSLNILCISIFILITIIIVITITFLIYYGYTTTYRGIITMFVLIFFVGVLLYLYSNYVSNTIRRRLHKMVDIYHNYLSSQAATELVNSAAGVYVNNFPS